MKYVFDFGLTEPVDCEHGTVNRPDIEFQFGKDKEQTIIEGFKITVEADDEKQADLIAKKRADRLMDILSATSGTFSEWDFRGMISSGGRVLKMQHISWSRRNNAVLDFPDEILKKILDGDHPLNKRLGYLKDARRAERTKDWESVIKYLHCEAQGKNEPLRWLRNLLTHRDNPNDTTRTEIKKHYPLTPDDGLKLDGGKFDPDDPHNAKSIELYARRFLNDAHTAIRNDIKNPS